jgi:hypothetical protein
MLNMALAPEIHAPPSRRSNPVFQGACQIRETAEIRQKGRLRR